MAIDWDKLQIKVIDDDHIPITDDYKYTMSSEQRMVIFAGRRGEQGPAGASLWGAIDGDIENQTDLADALALKADSEDLGTMASVDDAPSDSKEYVRKNGAWTESSGGGGGGETLTWGAITGTLSDQTDLQNALNAKANVADLGDLSTQDTVDYQTEVTNKPTLGTMSAVNDAPSDSKEYVRKNGAWTEATGGGGGGITSVSWGDINGTLANQTDLQTALDAKADESDLGELATKDTVDYQTEVTNKPSTFPPEAHIHDDRYYTESEIDALLEEKAPVIIGEVPVKLSGTYIVVPVGARPIDFKATLQVTQTGSGTPSAANIRPFESAEFCVVVKAYEYGDYSMSLETRNIPLPSAMYGGIVDVLNGTVIITHGHIASYNGETLPGVWYSDRDVYASGTTPTLGAEVVYELETPIEQTCSSYTPTMFSSRDTYLWASHQSQRLSVTNYTVAGAIDIYEQEIIDTKTYIDQNDALKANVADLGDLASLDSIDYTSNKLTNKPILGTMSAVNDAPSDSKEYVRKNGVWSEATGGISSVAWGDVTGTLSDQTDLATALNGKQNVLTFDSAPTDGSTNPVESGGVKTALDAKQDVLSFDSAPTANSTNPVTSSGIKTALDNKQDTLTFDTEPTAGSTKPVTSGGVHDAIVAGFRDVYKVTLPSASSSKRTFSAPGITADHVLCVEGLAYYSNPSAVMSELSITTAANSITITGTLSGTTDIIVTLGISRTITAS